MEALGFAAVVDGVIDVRTVSVDAYSAKRLALFWLFNINSTMETPEGYVDFLWQSSVAVLVGRNPERTVELLPIAVRVDDREVVEPPPPNPDETFIQRRARLTPKGPSGSDPPG